MKKWKMLREQKEAIKKYPDMKVYFTKNYNDFLHRYKRQFAIYQFWLKVNYLFRNIFGVTACSSDGDCDGVTISYVFRFLFWEVELGSTFTRSVTAPPDLPY